MVSKGPVVTTPTLFIDCIVLIIVPLYAAFGDFLRVDTVLHDFWFHVNKDGVSGETVLESFVSLEVCAYEPLAKQLTAIGYFLQ